VYEREHSIPDNYINCSITRRGDDGAWQRLERGEIPLWDFYVAFGRELSDTVLGNGWYREHCAQRGIDCPKLPEKLEIDGRDVSADDSSLILSYRIIHACREPWI